MDIKDIDVAHTAQREAFEEIGLQMSDVEVWGRLGVFPGKVCVNCCFFNAFKFYLLLQFSLVYKFSQLFDAFTFNFFSFLCMKMFTLWIGTVTVK